MNTLARLMNVALGLCGVGALVLGLAFWLGYARPLTRLHITLGIGVVLSLWALAGIAWVRTERRGLVAFALTWGLIVWMFGLTQGQFLRGSFHWLIELAHLAVGAIAIGVGAQLARAVAQRATGTESNAADATRGMRRARV